MTSIKFEKDYNISNYFLVESCPKLMTEITNSKESFYLKNGSQSNTIILSTMDNSYEIRHLETSNSLIVIEESKVITLLNFTTEATEYIPTNEIILKLLLKSSSISIIHLNNISNYLLDETNGLSLKDLLIKTDFSQRHLEKELKKMSSFQEKGRFFLFQRETVEKMFGDMFVLLKQRKEELSYVNVENVLNEYQLRSGFLSENMKVCLCEMIFQDGILKIDCVKLIISQISMSQIDSSNKKYDLNSFLTKFNLNLNLLLSSSLSNTLIQDEIKYLNSSCDDNLYDGFNKADLRFLKGFAYIAYDGTEEKVCFYEIHSFSLNFNSRLKEIFSLKSNWSYNELQVFFHFDNNLKEKLMKYCKCVFDRSRFNKDKEILYFKLKF